MIILDTNIVSYIFGGDYRALRYLPMIRGLRTFLSFQTLEELWFGAYRKGWGARRKNELSQHIEQYEIVWPNFEMVDICAQVRRERESIGLRLDVADAWIAATAILLQCPLASHDRDFSGISSLELIQLPFA